VTAGFRLPLAFDPDRLATALRDIDGADWYLHPQKRDYQGQWDVLPLRSQDGHPRRYMPGPNEPKYFAETPNLLPDSYFREVLAAIPMPMLNVRLMRLAPGAEILEHTDADLNFKTGELRLHVPVTTNPGVAFRLDGRLWPMQPGECWYLDFSRPHSVFNGGDSDRIHLVIDGLVTPWVTALFEQQAATA
jgi:hypothetical protein